MFTIVSENSNFVITIILHCAYLMIKYKLLPFSISIYVFNIKKKKVKNID